MLLIRLFAMLSIVLVFQSEDVNAQSSSWVKCANENRTCSFSGTKRVLYGQSTTSRNVIRSFSNRVACNNSVFGDPAPGTRKSCWYEVVVAAPAPTPTPAPAPEPVTSTWILCAAEYENCAFSGTREVRYGTSSQFVVRVLTSGTSCSNEVFGDPVPGSIKSCWYSSTVATEPDPVVVVPPPAPTPDPVVAAWTLCAGEEENCSFSGTREVRYGTNTQYVVRVLTSGTVCSNEIFGDPAVGVVKSCWYSGSTTAPVPDPVVIVPVQPPTPPTEPTPTPPPVVVEPVPTEPTPPVIVQPTGNIVASLTSNRISGVAPLAVQFDASNTTSSSVSTAFHLLRYDFNFGDDRGQSWSVSGLPKNTQSGGPIAAHVFDNPGTYTVRVTARNPSNGDSAQATLTITVQDPNVVFSGNNTICVSTSANYTGCPAGAVQQTSIPSIQSQKRILLKRGESFGGISINHGISNVLIGSYGSGNKPRVNRVDIGALNPSSSSFPTEIITMDLNIQESFTQYVTGSRLLLYRCDFDVPSSTDVDSQIGLSSALEYIVENHTLAANQYYQPREIFIVENVAFGSTSTPHTNMSGIGSQTVIMGNRMGIARQHTIRMYRMNKGFIAHNQLRGISSDGIRVALKLHSGGLGEYNDNYAISGNTWASRKVIIANNVLGDPNDTNSFTGGASPQNSGPDSREGLEDIILENNRFHRGPLTNTEFILMGRRVSNRGNVRIDGGQCNINQFGNSYELLPAEWNGPYFNN